MMLVSGFDGFLLKQDTTTIELSEVDAFVHSIPSEFREGYIAKASQFEKDIYTVLNVNLVFDYLEKSDLLTQVAADQSIVENDFKDKIDQNFIDKLGYTVDEFNQILKAFDRKKQYVVGFQHYIYNQIDDAAADELAEEYYKVNRVKYIKPKSMDLSQISFSKEKFSKEKVTEILNYIGTDSKERFTEMAVAHSSDPSVKSNKGELGTYKENLYKGHVGKEIFMIDELGMHSHILQDKENYYLVYINGINPQDTIPFDDVKVELRDSIKQNMADKKFNNIMSSISNKEIEVNIEQLATITERYLDNTINDTQ
ncbi:peptidylprolyl isomerase [Marinicella litoralis]|uniref:peptidylprolyl isomerase n=2 Tax=Marinicella litoralis TaxID=644220 RepID=A0A4V3DI54_9GAMM|nr:peptidylprolyl isomerase [Marinicella litoralis]TDR20811.1 parvulin-like peptidyl-prolyl isomerase [Marinicella litoralis]